jgi:hypothetical protein
MKSFFIALIRNPISLLGTALTTASALLIGTLFTLDMVGARVGPYSGIIAFLVLPAVFVVGLLLIPIGIAQQRRRDRRAAAGGAAPPAFPVIDLNREETRTRALIFFVLTALNLVILSTATYKGIETMESTEFCGEACHSVMEPQYTAFRNSPHANVGCVDCHIGPGANWFVKSKLSGSWQVVSVNLDLYPRPIPTPVHDLRPARETCEQCHWPEKFVGDRLRVIDRFAEDEANTPGKTVLLMRVGGVQGRESEGIHWHVSPGVEIRYLASEDRQTIYDVEMRTPGGEVSRFRAAGGAEAPAGAVWRTMDCVDCHNRPSHTFYPPEHEVDRALVERRIAGDLPFVKREGVRLLRASYPSHDEAARGIAAALAQFYQRQYPQVAQQRAEDVEAAAYTLGAIYGRNVFPSMNIGWGTYPNHIGHETAPGCFRCHDDEHATADGRTISQDCETCHTLLAMEEEDPEILRSLRP